MPLEPGPVFGVRVAGMPVDRLEALRFSDTWSEVDKTIRCADHVVAEGRRLADLLHPVIGAHSLDLRSELVALRRSLFRNARPSRRAWAPDVRAALPGDLTGAIVDWLAARERLRKLEDDLGRVLNAESEARIRSLRAAVTDPNLRQGVAQSSDALSGRLTAWLEASQDSRPTRQVLLRLAKYVARVAAKTSPYATFAASGLGAWTTGDVPRFAAHLPARLEAEAERLPLDLLWDRLSREPGLRDLARLRLNPSATIEDDGVWFLGAGEREPLRHVADGTALRAVFAAVAQGGTRTEVMARLGGPAPGAQEPDRLGQALEVLIDAGLVEVLRPYADQSPDALGDLVDWLRVQAPGHSLIEPLSGLRDAIRGYADWPVAQCVERRRDVNRLLAAADGAGGTAGLTVRENAVLRDHVAILPRTALHDAVADLDGARRLLALHDPGLPARLAVADFFHHRYGPDDTPSFLHFYRDLCDQSVVAGHPSVERFVHYRPVPDDAPLGDRVEHLRELRRKSWPALDLYAPGPVPTAALTKLSADWPAYVSGPDTLSCYGQLTADGLVVNMILAGPHTGVGRIRHLLGLPGAPHDNPVLAEFRNAVGSNLNLRPPVLRTIDYPRGGDPAGLPVGCLRVGFDPGTGLLCLRDPEGAMVRPVHLGLVALAHLPPAQAVLIRLLGVHPTVLTGGWALRDRLDVPVDGQVVYRPRLAVGTVVLARASWRMRAAVFPVPGPGEGDGPYLLRLARWLATHDVPRRVFARVLRPGVGRFDGEGKSYKPVYVDVTNWFLLQGFVRSLNEPDDLLVLEEALPDPAEAPCYGTDARVTEYVFDLTERRR